MQKSADKLAQDKYRFYEFAVQVPFSKISFINQEYRKARGRKALKLREDFCGTGWLAYEWIKQSPKHQAVGVDLSKEAVEYGGRQHGAKLKASQQKRIGFAIADVRAVTQPRVDVVVAFNFSYNVFKTRVELLAYFRAVRKSLKSGGMFFIDFFGGTKSQEERIRRVSHGAFDFFWECAAFNPVQNRGAYAIHFKPKGKALIRNAFQYDWRLWSCPELRDVMLDAGFKLATPYWEGSNAHGGGDGKFTATEWEENCRVWQSFLVGST